MRNVSMLLYRALLLVLAVGGLVILLLWMQGTIGSKRVEPGWVHAPAAPVPAGAPIVLVRMFEVEQWSEAVGTVKSRMTVAVSSKIMSHILEMRANPGDRVNQGDVLVLLDNREPRTQLEKAQSALIAARANLSQAQSNYARIKKLVSEQTATPAELEVVEAAYKVAISQVSQAEEAVREAQVVFGYTTITSPITGVVVEKRAEAGDLAVPGQTLLVIEDPTRLRLEASVPERQGGAIRVGDKVKVRIDALNQELSANVDEIVPAADPLSRSFLVKATLPQKTELRSGMFGRLLFAPIKTSVLCIPAKAVRRAGQLTIVDVMEDNKVHTRLIQTGKSYGEMVEVLSGLKPGEKILGG